MNVSGPLPVPTTPRPDETTVALRLNQRFSAEVMQVSGDRVVLSIEGVPIVAKMVSLEQAAQLIERRLANFIVQDLTGQQVTLQLTRPTAPAATTAPPTAALKDLVSNLLRDLGLPVDQANQYLARALLTQGLQVTAENINELRTLLNRLGLPTSPGGTEGSAAAQAEAQTQQTAGQATAKSAQGTPLPAAPIWGEEEAQIAAALKAAGLPLSQGTLALAKTDLAPLLESYSRLRAQLQDLAQASLPPRLTSLVQNSLAQLNNLAIDWSAPAPTLADNLRQAITLLGRSLEKDLANALQQSGKGSDPLPENGLIVFAQLRRELAAYKPDHPLLNELDRFLDGVRLRQFENSPPDTKPFLREQWLSLELPVGNLAAQPENRPDLHATHLRVSYRAKGQDRQIDPNQTRLVIQIDLNQQDFLEVDLSIVSQQVGLLVKASNSGLRQNAEVELPAFKTALERLGFNLQSARCEIGTRSNNSNLSDLGSWKDPGAVDLSI